MEHNPGLGDGEMVVQERRRMVVRPHPFGTSVYVAHPFGGESPDRDLGSALPPANTALESHEKVPSMEFAQVPARLPNSRPTVAVQVHGESGELVARYEPVLVKRLQ